MYRLDKHSGSCFLVRTMELHRSCRRRRPCLEGTANRDGLTCGSHKSCSLLCLPRPSPQALPRPAVPVLRVLSASRLRKLLACSRGSSCDWRVVLCNARVGSVWAMGKIPAAVDCVPGRIFSDAGTTATLYTKQRKNRTSSWLSSYLPRTHARTRPPPPPLPTDAACRSAQQSVTKKTKRPF